MKRERMKVSLIPVIVAMLFMLSSVVSAETIGNPANYMEAGSFAITAEYGMWDRDMTSDEGTGPVEGNRIFGKAMYGLNENLSLFAKVGMASAEFEMYDVDIETDMEMAFGVGAKFNFYDEDPVKAGIVIQFTKLSGEDEQTVDDLWIYGYGNYSGNLKGEFDGTEIDLGVGASYQVDDAIHCYGGLYFSKLSVDLEATASGPGTMKTDADEDDSIGIFVGGEYNFSESAKAGVEARIMAESSFSIYCGFAF